MDTNTAGIAADPVPTPAPTPDPTPAPTPAGPRPPPWYAGLLRALMHALARWPLPLLHGLGTLVGGGMRLLPNRQRRNALINLALCFPHLPPAELIRLRNRHLLALGRTYLELPRLWLRPSAEVLGLVREVRGGEWLARGDGRGLIVLSPHLGAWELAGLYLAAQGPTAIFYKPQRLLDDLIVAARGRTGATMAPITARGVRALVEALRRGEYVGILPDQEPRAGKGAAFAPFCGVPAWTMVLVNRLARKSGARVVFLFAERLPARWWRTGGFRLHCRPAPAGIDSDDDLTAAAALNQGIANCIALCPEQYLWSYRRFRRRPPGWPRTYDTGRSDHAALAKAAALRDWQRAHPFDPSAAAAD